MHSVSSQVVTSVHMDTTIMVGALVGNEHALTRTLLTWRIG
jgi:hypothetical protein